MSASSSPPPSIKVMLVDDSAVARQGVAEMLARTAGIELMVVASEPGFAMNKLRNEWPDVIILDVDTPRLDGLGFLRRIMSDRPTPVIAWSTRNRRGNASIAEALAAGAFSTITKPDSGLKEFLVNSAQEIIAAIRAAARANPPLQSPTQALPTAPGLGAEAEIPPTMHGPPPETADKVIALGTSTGGTQALEAVLTSVPPTVAGIVVVQHMPERFTAMFAQRLDNICAVSVREARHNDDVIPGRALIAPGGHHMVLKRTGSGYRVDIVDGPVVNRHKPSVDVLFGSVARCAGRNALGVIMTGMGDDGARGLSEMRQAGAVTIAQDEASSVVFGMPKEAIRLGAAERVLPLGHIPGALVAFSSECRR